MAEDGNAGKEGTEEDCWALPIVTAAECKGRLDHHVQASQATDEWAL